MANKLSELFNRSGKELGNMDNVPVVKAAPAPSAVNKYRLTDDELRNLPKRKKKDYSKTDAAAEDFLKKYYGSRHPDVGIKP